MPTYAPTHSRPVVLGQSTESTVYALFAVAMGLTVLGVYFGMQIAPMLMGTGMHIVLLIVQLGLLFSSRLWIDKSPLNVILFGLFPIISGMMITPYILYVLTGYGNGASILMNAFAATACMSLAAAVFARTTTWNLGVLGRACFFGVLGLIFFGILQIFVPALQTTQFELMLSGAGIIIFSVFTAYDLQRIQQMGQAGANPFMLALSLYLDIFNLFLYILRFMLAISGDRR